jgi:hypothetical protein
MKTLYISAALTLGLTGCAVRQPIASEVSSALRTSTVAQTIRTKTDFSARTASLANGSIGLIGLLAEVTMVREGNRIVALNRIEDPAEAIAKDLGNALASAHGVSRVAARVAVSSDEPAEIAQAGKQVARYILDVKTVLWNFQHFPIDWTHYRVTYAARARLVDTITEAVVASGACMYIPTSTTGAPTHDELMAEDAARLKTELVAATLECSEKLKQDMGLVRTR